MKNVSAAKVYTALIVFAFVILSWSQAIALCNKQDLLFKIERSKNRNVVHYVACLLENGALSASNPVEVYWILDNGKREGLNRVEEKFGYGIGSIKKLGEDELRIVVKALKDREITVKKVQREYQAFIWIKGELSLFEKAYVESKDSTFGLPKVIYAILFGRNLQTNQPAQERITPH